MKDVQKAEPNLYWKGGGVDFTKLSLICTLDATRIRYRWSRDFIPSLNEKTKVHLPNVLLSVSHVFKAYPANLLKKGHLPSYIHPSQLAGPNIPTSLANCLSLVRLWDGQVRGGEAFVQNTVKNDIGSALSRGKKLSTSHHNSPTCLQASVLQPEGSLGSISGLHGICNDSISFRRRQVACRSSTYKISDLKFQVESLFARKRPHTRPDWESWITASTKRRCVYTMCLFDNLFCTLNGLPTFRRRIGIPSCSSTQGTVGSDG